jgi:hypothetical protein
MKKLIAVALMAAFAAFTSLNLHAADKDQKPPAEKAGKSGHLPFHGKVVSVDKTAKTIKVGERTFHVMGTTNVNKTGKPATLDDVTVGEEVRGAYTEKDGKLELLSLGIGPAPEKKPKGDK